MPGVLRVPLLFSVHFRTSSAFRLNRGCNSVGQFLQLSRTSAIGFASHPGGSFTSLMPLLPDPIADTHSAATTVSKPNKSFRQSSPRPATTRTQRFRLSVSFIITQPALKPPHCCTDLCNVLVHRFDAVVERFSILLTLAQFSREPQPHFADSPA